MAALEAERAQALQKILDERNAAIEAAKKEETRQQQSQSALEAERAATLAALEQKRQAAIEEARKKA